MNDFKLEVGGHCANGAKVIALFMNESEGKVSVRAMTETAFYRHA